MNSDEEDNDANAVEYVKNNENLNGQVQEEVVTRAGRIRRPAARLRDDDFQSHIPKVNSKVNAVFDNDTVVEEKYLIFNLTIKQGLKKHGEDAHQSINKELETLLKLGVWEPVDPSVSNEDVSKYLIPSKLSLKEKFKPNGEFDKLKSRQVAGGYMQDSKLYPDKSSSIFIVSAIAAHKRSHVASSDIGNVYVNADISGPPVYMN